MRCITLTQPWATLVAIGAKQIETRSWRSSYRGKLAIHAAKGLGPVGGSKGLYDLCYDTEPFASVLRDWYATRETGPFHVLDYLDRLRGAIVAVCELVDCWPTCGDGTIRNPRTREIRRLEEPERSFGDYTPGRYAWLLANVKMLAEPIPCKGALSLWEPDTLTQLAIKRQEIVQL